MLKFRLKDQNILRGIHNFAKNRRVKLCLVGGALRDLMLKREKAHPDFDFAAKRGAISFGRNLAKEMQAGFVILDKEHGACRLVKKINQKTYTFDFSDFRGKSLEEDLKHRDFTINSMALELGKAFSAGGLDNFLVDPYGAQEDLSKKLIRITNKKSFSEDPLRILRAFSFACILDFTIDKETLQLVKSEKVKLSGVSFERVRDELFKIFDTEKTFDCFVVLDKLKILEIIFPEIKKMRGIGQGPYHHLDVWQHTLESIKQFDLLIKEIKDEGIQEYLDAVISGDRSRRQLLKLGLFLHDVGKPVTMRHEKGRTTFHGHERAGLSLSADIAKRLKLSNDELYSLHKMVLWHLRPGYLADSEKPTPRAKFRYFRDAGSEALSVLLLSLSDQRATKGPLTTMNARKQHERVVARLIREYLAQGKEKKKERLVNGNDIMKALKLPPSKLIGRILSELDELQAIGKIKTKEEAFRRARKFIKSKKR
ncbi:MAG: HD domain-containing protein [Candidatus Omnitrophota bacterium]|nr:HD domain-containing protein [Candidatus Omnitrophota bacterium]